MSKGKILRNAIVSILALIVIISFSAPVTFAATKNSGSDTDYVEIIRTPVKVGKYYYKLTNNGNVARSKSKNNGYKVVISKRGTSDFFDYVATNGKKIIYIYDDGNHTLRKCACSGKDDKLIKKIPSNAGHLCCVSTIYKGNIYISTADPAEYNTTYKYNIKSNNFSKVAEKCGILYRKGKYVITASYWNTEGGAGGDALYKITPSGNLKKVKNLCSVYGDAEFVGKHIYYVDFVGKRDKQGNVKYPIKVNVYRCKYNGSHTKKIVSKSFNKGVFLGAFDFTSKKCDLAYYNPDNWGYYRLYFKTGKFIKLER